MNKFAAHGKSPPTILSYSWVLLVGGECKIMNTKWNNDYRGMCNSQRKLTEEQVKEIKVHIKQGKLLVKEIAKLYNVQPATISNIKNGRTWVPSF